MDTVAISSSSRRVALTLLSSGLRPYASSALVSPYSHPFGLPPARTLTARKAGLLHQTPALTQLSHFSLSRQMHRPRSTMVSHMGLSGRCSSSCFATLTTPGTTEKTITDTGTVSYVLLFSPLPSDPTPRPHRHSSPFLLSIICIIPPSSHPTCRIFFASIPPIPTLSHSRDPWHAILYAMYDCSWYSALRTSPVDTL
ncbi:hypothetical protein B0H12DRAFT_1119042 [Mycena haematopus]|nr:hypothetical protein B0H12DRAFT_1119042 [Mycena haematopus]